MRIRIHQFAGWEDFKSGIVSEIFEDGIFRRGEFIFRGQRSSSWELISSFDRWLNTVGCGNRNRWSLFEKLITAFKRDCESREYVASDLLDNEYKLYALGQHHGLPTVLLDWTESPYVSAFFAFSDLVLSRAEEDFVAVWALDTREFIWNKHYGVEILYVPSIANVRLRNQSGRFTLSRTPFACLEDYVEKFEGDVEPLSQFLIPAHEAQLALTDLDVMGINYATLFPDITGSAMTAKMRLMFADE